MKLPKFFKYIEYQDLKDALDSYDTNIVNTVPNTAKELLRYFECYSDPVISIARKINNDNVFTLGNEVRAMLGHIADYYSDSNNKKNLRDAYGHFRRINIDSFKILCNMLDKQLLKYMDSHIHYDFRGVNTEFLKKYSTQYFSAKQMYLDAQLKERTGSDISGDNIILKYYNATKAYSELVEYLEKNKTGIDKTVIKSIFGVGAKLFISVASIIVNFM